MSAHIAIRCDECGKVMLGAIGTLTRLYSDAQVDGWQTAGVPDLCPFCVARRKARERAEAAAK